MTYGRSFEKVSYKLDLTNHLTTPQSDLSSPNPTGLNAMGKKTLSIFDVVINHFFSL